MTLMNQADKNSLTDQIRQVEARTHGEIVTVIAERSDDYRYIPILWAALLALSIPGIYYLMVRAGLHDWQPEDINQTRMGWVYCAQVIVFIVAAMLFQWEPIRMRLIPNHVKQFRASRHAQEQFLTQHVHWTDHRAGILLFVSEAEHYVEILVDQALAEKVDNTVWQSTIDRFILSVRNDRITEGFSGAIDDCRAVLWEHFPRDSTEVERVAEELPNHLIEV